MSPNPTRWTGMWLVWVLRSSVYASNGVLTHIYGQMSFLWKVTGVFPEDCGQQGTQEEPVEVVLGISWGCIPDVSPGRVCGHIQLGRDPGRSRTCWRDYAYHLALERPGVLPEKMGGESRGEDGQRSQLIMACWAYRTYWITLFCTKHWNCCQKFGSIESLCFNNWFLFYLNQCNLMWQTKKEVAF